MIQHRETCKKEIKYNKIWLSKALGFLTIKRNFMVRLNSDISIPHDKASYKACTIAEPTKFEYVQYYEVLGDDDVLKDNEDNILYFVILKWKRNGVYKERRTKLKVFALCPY